MKKIYLFLIYVVCAYTVSYAQMTQDTVQLDEVTIAGRLPDKRADVISPVTQIRTRDIQFRNPQTSADLLMQTGKVFVQKSQMGGGSPVLRGMEANRVLLVVDGVRMNNAIYRGGHLQNVITVDPNIQNRVEVLYGTGSVMYGSDALGGVIQFYTQKPEFSSTNDLLVKGNMFTRFASVNRENTGHIDLNLGFQRWAFFSSISYSDFDDLRAGKRTNSFYDFRWDRTSYVERINEADTEVKNANPQIQKFSGYNQLDLTQKIAFKPNDYSTHTLNVQYSNSSDIPRYDRLTDIRNGKLRFAEWNYGPQKRVFGSYTFENTRSRWYADNIRLIASYQDIEESRIQRETGSTQQVSNIEKLHIYGINTDLSKKISDQTELRYGVEWYYNDVQSHAFSLNNVTNVQGTAATRYPDGGSTMNLGGFYARISHRIGKILFVPAIRLSYVSLNAKTTNENLSPFFTSVQQKNTAVSGQLGAVWNISSDWRLTSSVSTGFRAPNIDDIGKTFDIPSGLTLPNPDLKPEQSLSGDLGIEKTTDRTHFEANVFYTQLYNALKPAFTTYQGKDSVLFNNNKTRVQKIVNTGKACIYGGMLDVDVRIASYLMLFGNVTYTLGHDVSQDVPMDHIPPVYGRVGIRLNGFGKKLQGELYGMYNGWKRLKDYSPSGEDNLKYAIPTEGMPAWYTLNLKGSYQILPTLSIQAGIENLMDVHYRVFASGISSPGRNFVLTLRGNF